MASSLQQSDMNFKASLCRYISLAAEVAFIFNHDEEASKGVIVSLTILLLAVNLTKYSSLISAENLHS
jgi:hypothetical protein